tara:strand:- start:96 stop:278 length:183 start_codon:yes stop_codon:yes gene_type:complete
MLPPSQPCAIPCVFLSFSFQLKIRSKMNKLRIGQFRAQLAHCHAKLAGQEKLKIEPAVLL